jgi:hypothetical protein
VESGFPSEGAATQNCQSETASIDRSDFDRKRDGGEMVRRTPQAPFPVDAFSSAEYARVPSRRQAQRAGGNGQASVRS